MGSKVIESVERKQVKDKARHGHQEVVDINSVPNGGGIAWLQVLGSFILLFNSWGVVNTFGIFQTYYENELLRSSSPSAISWIGSIQSCLLQIIGFLVGPLYDAGHFRALLICGTFLVTCGTMCLSVSSQFYQILLAQALCVGIGFGCIFVPSLAILPTYFTSQLPLAIGIASSGGSLGGVVYPIMWHNLLRAVGFGWATRILGFFVFLTLLIPIAVMKVRVLPERKRSLIDLGAFRHRPFVIFVLSSLIIFMGLYVPFFYIELYSISEIHSNSNLNMYLLPIVNAASVFGRIVPNLFTQYIGPPTMYPGSVLISGILAACFIPVNSLSSLILLCLLFGFSSGAVVSLPPAVIVHLKLDRGMIGTHMGMAYSIISIGLLVGTPIAGAIQSTGGFQALWLFSGLAMTCGGISLLIARFSGKMQTLS